MISDERKAELEELFWNETNDEESQEWRYDLTAEEMALVDEWDSGYDKAYFSLLNSIKKCSVL